MKVSTLVTAAVLCALGSTAMAQQSTQPTERTPSSMDQGSAMPRDKDSTHAHEDRADSKLTSESFAKKAAAAGLAEVEMGKLGVKKAVSPEVKKYAQHMVDDHTKGNKELMTAAKGKVTDLPTSPDMKHKAMMEKFDQQKADADFDEDFMEQMVRDHKQVIELYEKASTDPDVDPQLQAVAKKSLPTLREHLKKAEAMERQLSAADAD
jgi:putative membrane protein